MGGKTYKSSKFDSNISLYRRFSLKKPKEKQTKIPGCVEDGIGLLIKNGPGLDSTDFLFLKTDIRQHIRI